MHSQLPESVAEVLKDLPRAARLTVLTGAGISAESGVPTFRGKDGYWQQGSRHYQPMELATCAAFQAMPETVWSWYLYRRAVCLAARPNPAHLALAQLDLALGAPFRLITQNVDGLHLRAGSVPERTYQIHGNIHFMRCSVGCSEQLHPLPESLDTGWPRGRMVMPQEMARLRCPLCNAPTRPHVLWFDEYYDELYFRFDSSLNAAQQTDLLIVVGTTGATNLPLHVCHTAARAGAALIVINPEPTTFTRLAETLPRGAIIHGRAGQWVPRLVDALLK